MLLPENPFITSGYAGAKYFCDREQETLMLLEAIRNRRHLTLYSRRKMGKTALIRHCFERLGKTYLPILVDLHPTRDFSQFVQATASALTQQVNQRSTIGKKVWESISKLRPTISYDALTGQPQVTLTSTTIKQHIANFDALIVIVKELNKRIVIAFDEFQQILEYPEQNTEALLRSKIQELPDVSFLFCGSDQHLLSEMFLGPKRPFYQMTQMMTLGPITQKAYNEFIRNHFLHAGKSISRESITSIIEWARGITFYVQYIANRLFSRSQQDVSTDTIKTALHEILAEFDEMYFGYRRILTTKQWRVLEAIALETQVNKPFSQQFMKTHHFTNAASLKRAIESLLKSGLLYTWNDASETWYEVNDIFLLRWIQIHP